MLIIEDKPLWTFYRNTYWVFPDVKLSRQFKFEFGKNFYKDNDRYGRELIILKFPLNTRILKKNNNIILLNSQNYSTHLLWSYNPYLVACGKYNIHTTLDYNNSHSGNYYYYHLISARKGTTIRLRDGEQEMELVF